MKIINKTSANSLTKQVLRILDLKGYYAWRQPAHGVYDPTKKIFRSNSIKRGVSDVIGFKRIGGNARFIAVEIKVGNDKLSSEQSEFLNDVRAAGGIAEVVKNSDDIEKLIKKI